MSEPASSPIRYAIASRPRVGERCCGDQAGVRWLDDGLIAVLADGLGHGSAAKDASSAVVATVLESSSSSIAELLGLCHERLINSRGAAVGIVKVGPDHGQYVGVGNVEISGSGKASVGAISHPGIVGRRMRKVQVFDFSWAADTILWLHSDGIHRSAAIAGNAAEDLQAEADRLVAEHGLEQDDVSVLLVAR